MKAFQFAALALFAASPLLAQQVGHEPAKSPYEDLEYRQELTPFYGYALRPGITFTYLGLKVNDQAAVHFGGVPSRNLFVAGEMMAGNVLGQGYTAGVGMSIGTAFGRIAGTQAARAALSEAVYAAA